MKKSLLIFTTLLFWGCEKIEFASEPSIAGRWSFDGYHIARISSISNVEIIKNDTICINSFNEQSFVSGGVLMKQNYELTSPERRLVIGDIWEFDGTAQATSYDLIVRNNPENNIIKADFPRKYLSSKYEKIVIKNLSKGVFTDFTFRTYAQGSLGRTMDVTSTPIVTDLYLTNGQREKAVTVKVILHFSR